MRKAFGIALVLAIFLAFGFAPVDACRKDDPSKTSASTTTSTSTVCSKSALKQVSASTTDGKSCSASKISAEAKACQAGAKAYCSPEECAQWGKMCEKYGNNCEMRFISIEGMTCGGCENSVKASLMKVAGVLDVAKVSHESKVAVVCVDPSKIENEVLTTAVTNKGYTAEIVPAVATSTDNSVTQTASTKIGCSKTCSKICTGAKNTSSKSEDVKVEKTGSPQ